MKKLFILLSVAIILIMSGCGNTLTRNFGGTMTINLEPNTKLENITWKDGTLWYLTRPMRIDEEAETYTYQEKSNFGVIEGKITIIEYKK